MDDRKPQLEAADSKEELYQGNKEEFRSSSIAALRAKAQVGGGQGWGWGRGRS